MRLKNFLSVVAAVAMASLGGGAFATSVASGTLGASQPANSPGLAASLIAVTGLSNANVLSGVAGDLALGGGGQVGGLNVKRFALSGNTGAAAAPGAKLWNVWGAFSRSNVSYNFAPLQSSGNVNVFLTGVDYTFDSNVVFGLAVAVDRTDVDLNFSGGKLKGSGTTLSPYLGIPINKNLAFDATIGYGRTNIDTTVAGVSGSTKDDRIVGSLGLTYRAVIDAWNLSGRAAYLAVQDKLGAYTLSNGTFVPDGTVNVSQIRFVGEAAYTSGPLTPFASLAYINDVRRPDQAPVNGLAAANDRDAWTPTIGIRFKADNGFYGGFRYSNELGRSEVKNIQFLFHLGARF